MKLWLGSTLMLAVVVTICAAQQSPSTNTGNQTGVFQVGLTRSLDSKKLKVGDVVTAAVVGDVNTTKGTTVRRGSRVIGHVTQVQNRSKGAAQSMLAMSFDKIELKGGESLPIQGMIQAVGPNPNPPVNTGGGIEYGGLNETMEKPPTPDMTPGSVPLLNPNSTGVVGLKNIELGSQGVLTSNQKDIKLDSGTRLLLKVMM